ncbi:hypothetical protein GCM10020220_047740 [Nonomuraea rubra]
MPGGHGHYGQIHAVGNLGVAGQPGHLGGVRVDRMDRPVEAAVEQITQHLVAHRPLVAARADHGHRTRGEHPGQGRSRSLVIARLDALPQPGRGASGDVEVHHATLEAPRHVQTEVVQHPDHRPVLGQHVGDQRVHLVLGRVQRDVFEQQRAQPVAVHGVVDEDGQVGLAVVHGDVLRDRDQPAPQSRHQGVPAVDAGGDAIHVGMGGAPAAGEEAQVGRAFRRTLHQLVQGHPVAGMQPAHMGDAAVAQQDVITLGHGPSPVLKGVLSALRLSGGGCGRQCRTAPASRPKVPAGGADAGATLGTPALVSQPVVG